MVKTEDTDKIILALRAKYHEKMAKQQLVEREIDIGINKVPLQREILFGGKCSIMLPVTMTDMDYLSKMVRYRSQNRPQVIKVDYGMDATVTFSQFSADSIEEDVSGQMEQICLDMKKIWKQNVFYDRGEVEADGFPVAWMDFRAFCMDGNIYSLLFIFQVDEQMILGNFHCSFSKYDMWKPVVLKLLSTIKKAEEETENERISDKSGTV